MDKKGVWLTIITLGLVLVPLIVYAVFVGRSPKPGQYDQLAECLTKAGAKMYGAYWCAHCADQKKLFGNSFAKINYVECSLPGSQEQAEVCRQAGINSYPTWEFGDGSRTEGQMSLAALAQKTSCSFEEVNK